MTTKSPVLPTIPTPPGPHPAYPFQHLVAMMRDPLPLLERAAKYGDVTRIGMGARASYLINNPEAIRDVLVTNHRMFIKSLVVQRLSAFLGQGLLTSEGELHLRQRRLIQPAFHRQRIAEYAGLMTSYALETSERWQDGQTLDIHHEMMRLTMVVVGQALFGTNVERESAEIGQAITILLHNSRRLMLPFWDRLQYWPLPGNREALEAGELVDRRIREMIEARQKEEHRQASDLLDMLLMARDEEGDGKGMSAQQVRDEVMTLFLAGHETTANALTWTLYLLSQHAEIEARLHEELDGVLGHAALARIPGAEDVERLPYTRMVLSEAMRLYPPAWIIGREAKEDYNVGGYTLPAGSTILMSQWVMHRDPRYFPDPERFDPQRWTPEAQAARPRFSYFPFGGGPRLCVGEPFAWMEGILILAVLCGRWKLRLAGEQRVEPLPQITLRPKYGMNMELQAR